MDLDKIEERIRTHAVNWPLAKLYILASDILELLDERDKKIVALENKVRILQGNKEK